MTLNVGLTGSIGMGKSTTAKMFEAHGIPVWDADAAVHRLYATGGPAIDPMSKVFPDVVVDSAVSRDALKRLIDADSSVLRQIEQIVHPLVAQDRQDFIKTATSDILMFDIPLLFETGADQWLDTIITVTVSPELQRKRVLDRPGMTADRFEAILAKQTPDAEKCRRSDFVIETTSIEHAEQQVAQIVKKLRDTEKDA